jgi:hypothetical protein
MSKIKILFVAVICLVPCLNYGQYTDVINSNRPGETMSAYATGKSVFQIETGAFGITQKHNLLNYQADGLGVDLVLRWGLFLEELELVADLQYQSDQYTKNLVTTNRSALKQTVLGAKYLIYDPFKNYKKKIDLHSWKANQRFDWHQMIPALSLFAGANLSFSDNPYSFTKKSSVSPKLMLITQNHFGDGRWVFVTNIIADFITTDYPSYGYVITLTRGFNKKWSGFVENQGFKSDFYSDALLRGGAAYLISKNLQVDASLTTNFKETPSIFSGGLGLSWRYDANYKEIKMKAPETKASKKSRKIKKG